MEHGVRRRVAKETPFRKEHVASLAARILERNEDNGIHPGQYNALRTRRKFRDLRALRNEIDSLSKILAAKDAGSWPDRRCSQRHPIGREFVGPTPADQHHATTD